MANHPSSIDGFEQSPSLSPYRGAALPEPEELEDFYKRPKDQRRGVAICLSGGGYRAALFHLGGLRRLNELGVLAKVDAISAVSGGSILAAVLAEKIGGAWPNPESVPAAGPDIPADIWKVQVEDTLLKFTQRDIRTKAAAKRYLSPWGWFHPSTAVDTLAEAYMSLTKMTMGDLPNRPEYIFGATDLRLGRYWTFARNYDGSASCRSRHTDSTASAPLHLANPAKWPVAKAVAASSCFPPVFDPMHIHAEQLAGEGNLEDIYLSDGGVIDNMGFAALWEKAATVLISDGGGQFQQQWKNFWPWRLMRYSSVVGAQSGRAQRTWLLSNLIDGDHDGAYWGLSSDVSNFPNNQGAGYAPDVFDGYIHRIRTDLNRFSHEEQYALMNHGYLLADSAIRSHARSLARHIDAPLILPNDRLLQDKVAVKDALRWSHSSWAGPRFWDRARRTLNPIWPHNPPPRESDSVISQTT